MHLAPRDLDKLILHQAGFLAQKRLARGVQLNYPEAVALIATQLLEFIRDGASVSDLMDRGRQLLGRANVMPGVAEMIHDVQIEGTFADGTKLVTVHSPVVLAEGNLELALYGSFLPVPNPEVFRNRSVHAEPTPGEFLVAPGTITLNPGRRELELLVRNVGDRPIQVGSHFPFAEVNTALEFDRNATTGMRLDVPAGTAVRFEPGDEKTIRLVATVQTSTEGWSPAGRIARLASLPVRSTKEDR